MSERDREREREDRREETLELAGKRLNETQVRACVCMLLLI